MLRIKFDYLKAKLAQFFIMLKVIVTKFSLVCKFVMLIQLKILGFLPVIKTPKSKKLINKYNGRYKLQIRANFTLIK